MSEDPEPAAVRRQGGEVKPLGPKAARTRERILHAATGRFVTQGYQRTSIADIAEAAGISPAAVYQYFRDRREIVAALVLEVVDRLARGAGARWRVEDGLPGVNAMILNFVDAYVEGAAMARVWEEVSHIDPELAKLRRDLTRAFASAVTEELARARASGLLTLDADAELTARALTGMVDRFCYTTYVLDPPAGGAPQAPDAAGLLARLWAGAIGLGGVPDR